MNTSHLLVAYPRGGESLALKLVETLDGVGITTLRPYSRMKAGMGEHRFDVALCIVMDQESVAEAHDLQHRLEDVPTIVVDNAQNTAIPVNGFIGRASCAHDPILEMVTEILHADTRSDSSSGRNDRSRPAFVSRFDATLSRLGGVSEGYDTLLSAATRQLAWELRAMGAEACALDIESQIRRVYCSLSEGLDLHPIPDAIGRILKAKRFLVCKKDLTRKADAPLIEYLETQRLNVIAPLMPDYRLLGWLAFRLDETMLTDAFLDDLHIAAHLLALTLRNPSEEPPRKANSWHQVLAEFNVGMLTLGPNGKIIDVMGDTSLLGLTSSSGHSLKSVRNGHIREVIAEALRGNLTTKIWVDARSGQSYAGAATALGDKTIALRFERLMTTPPKSDGGSSSMVELSPLLESLTLPVLVEGAPGSTAGLPKGCISTNDSESIRRCAQAAISGEAKALRIRFTPDGKSSRAVLFFETPAKGEESFLGRDISHAVEFRVTTV